MFMDHDTSQILQDLQHVPAEEPSRKKQKHDLKPSHPFLDGLHLPHHTTAINTKGIPPIIDDQYFTLELDQLAQHEARLSQLRTLIREKTSQLEDLENGIDRNAPQSDSVPTPVPEIEVSDLSRPAERAMLTNALGSGRTVRIFSLNSNVE
jgi:hypothetical protein